MSCPCREESAWAARWCPWKSPLRSSARTSRHDAQSEWKFTFGCGAADSAVPQVRVRCRRSASIIPPANGRDKRPVSSPSLLVHTRPMTDVLDNQSASALLGADGPFARELPNFAPRETQQRMADAVARAIDEGGTLVAEAGTGTGKTFAYLVPALLSGKRVIVSTGTRNLQDQLFHRDLPRVRSVLGAKVDAALLKGRANYLCLYRLEQTAQDGTFKSKTQVHDLQAIRAWRSRTRSGDRSELAEVPEGSPLWPRVTSTTENCLGSECPFYDDCFVMKARRRAQEADIVVVNHHLLFADLALKQEGFGDILPGAHAFILDEAHQIPELAGQFFSVSISARQLSELASDALAECAGQPGALSLLQAPVDGVNWAVKRLRLALDRFPAKGAMAQIESEPNVDREIVALREALAFLAESLGKHAERSRGLAS